MVATAALILGLATAASAAHLNLLPSWLTRIVGPGTVAPAREGARMPRLKARSGSPASSEKAPPPSPDQGVPPVEQMTAETSMAAGTADPMTAPSSPTKAREPSPTRKVAFVDRNERPSRSTSPRPSTVAMPSLVAPKPEITNPSPRAMVTNGPSQGAPSPWPAPTTAVPMPSPGSSVASISPNPAPERISPTAPQGQNKQGAAKYLTEAIRLSRVERSPATALRLLDSHDGELAKGGLGHEALILRVEALLALDRRAEVLRLLDGAFLTDVAASRALLVTRGELRAAAKRCSEGIGDFDLVLARSRQVDRRALTGRALCRKQLGDIAGARVDVQRLRQEFPSQPLPGELEK